MMAQLPRAVVIFGSYHAAMGYESSVVKLLHYCRNAFGEFHLITVWRQLIRREVDWTWSGANIGPVGNSLDESAQREEIFSFPAALYQEYGVDFISQGRLIENLPS